jgi:hypothetical protein
MLVDAARLRKKENVLGRMGADLVKSTGLSE